MIPHGEVARVTSEHWWSRNVITNSKHLFYDDSMRVAGGYEWSCLDISFFILWMDSITSTSSSNCFVEAHLMIIYE